MGGGGMRGNPFGGRKRASGGSGNPFGGRQRKRARCGQPAQKARSPIPLHTKVTVHGLKSKAEYNGKVGEVVDYTSGSKRFVVRLESDGRPKISVRPKNLVQHV